MTKAFKAHFIKEVGQSQLMGAAKTLLDKNQWLQLKRVDNASSRSTTKQEDGRGDTMVKKIGTFKCLFCYSHHLCSMPPI